MGYHRYSELGRSLGIFNDQLPWYWKLFASGSSWLLLAGYVKLDPEEDEKEAIFMLRVLTCPVPIRFLLFPLAMDYESSKLGGNRQALIAVSLVLVVVASFNCVVYCVRWRKAYELIDSIFLYAFPPFRLATHPSVLRELGINFVASGHTSELVSRV